jgi:plasmid stability protein
MNEPQVRHLRVCLTDEQVRALKVLAAKRDQSMQDLATEAMEKMLEEDDEAVEAA